MTGDGSEKILDVIISTTLTLEQVRRSPKTKVSPQCCICQSLTLESWREMWRIFINDKYPLDVALEEDGCHDWQRK